MSENEPKAVDVNFARDTSLTSSTYFGICTYFTSEAQGGFYTSVVEVRRDLKGRHHSYSGRRKLSSNVWVEFRSIARHFILYNMRALR